MSKKKTRLLSIVIAVTMVFTCVPAISAPVFATSDEAAVSEAADPAGATTVASGSCGQSATWTLDKNGLLTISGSGPMSSDAYNSWSTYKRSIKKVIIKDGITCISNNAFEECIYLYSVTIPDSVTEIGIRAFALCYDLVHVTIPDGVTVIGSSAFRSCQDLTSVTIPSNLTEIGSGVFSYCYELTSVTIPDSVTKIGGDAFRNCRNLLSISVPDSVTKIDGTAFIGCGIVTFYVTEGSAGYKYAQDEGLKVDTVNPMPTIVAGGECGDNAAWTLDVKGLLTISGSGPMSDEAFESWSDYTSKIRTVFIEEGITSIGYHAFRQCDKLTEVTIPDSVTTIGQSAFSSCTELRSVTIPEGVTKIDKFTFYKCTSLISVVIPEGVTEIEYYAFEGCSNLTDVTLPAELTSIGTAAFYGCSSLTNITVPSCVIEIGDGAFHACSNLTIQAVKGSAGYKYAKNSGMKVEVDDSKPSIVASGRCGEDAVWILDENGLLTISGSGPMYEGTDQDWGGYGESIKIVVVNEGITAIGDYKFQGCNNLTSVTIPESVTEIGTGAFDGCGDMTIHATAGSAGHKYAQDNNVEVQFVQLILSSENTEVVIDEEIIKYTGSEIEPAVIVSYKNKELTEGLDYSVDYNDNTDAGEATVIITGKGYYGGTVSKTFVIEKADQPLGVSVDAVDINLGKTVKIKTEGYGAITFESGDPAVAVVDENGVITGKSIGTATITVTAAGNRNYNAASKKFKITVCCKHEADYIVSKPYIEPGCETEGAGEERICSVCRYVVQEVTVITPPGHKYVLSLVHAAKPGKDGTYKNVCSACSDTVIKSIAAPKTITLAKTKLVYNGKVQKPAVTVKDSKGRIIAADNYTVTYPSGCKNPGTYTVKITFKGNYSGTMSAAFKIIKGTQIISVADKSIAVGSKASLKAKRTVGNGKLSYKTSNKKVAVVNSKGEVTAKAVGTAYITVSAKGTSTYNAASQKVKITVKPKGKSLSSVLSSKNGQLTVKWKKASGITGYQIRYSTNKNMSGAKTVTISKAKTVKKTLSGLKKGKKYYVQLRTYKYVKGKNYYSSWSSAKSRKTKNVKLKATVKPKGKSLSSVLSSKNGQLTVKWKKASGITGYQIRYSTNKNMSGAKTVTISKAKTVKKTLSGLKKGKKYYVQLRTYKSVKGKKYYSSWSSAKSRKTMNVKLNATSLSIKKGTSKKLSVRNTFGKTVKWNSSKPGVATVSSSGKVSAKKKGTCTITATIGNQKLKCKLAVK